MLSERIIEIALQADFSKLLLSTGSPPWGLTRKPTAGGAAKRAGRISWWSPWRTSPGETPFSGFSGCMHNPLFRRHLRQPRGRHVCLFALTPSHRPTFLLTYTPPHLSTKPQLLHPLLPVCCGAMGVPFHALYDIGMCTCTRLRSMTTTTITFTITTMPLESTKQKGKRAVLGLTARDWAT